MIKVAICDDDLLDINHEYEVVALILKKYNLKYSIDKYGDAEAMLESGEIYDIVFLDIQMNKIDGIDLARRLIKNNKNCIVIYITNYSIYLDDAFDVRAYGYLCKPLDEKRLELAIKRAVARVNDMRRHINVTHYQYKMEISVNISEIIYIENSNRHTRIVTSELDFIAKEKFTEVKMRIENKVRYFASPHSSLFVNLRCVQNYNKKRSVYRILR